MTITDTRRIGKKPSKRTLKQIDQQIEALYYRHAHGRQINVLDIGNVFAAGRAVGPDDREAAVIAAIAQYTQEAK